MTRMQTVGKDINPPKPLPLPNSDFYQLAETLPPEELATMRYVRSFMKSKVTNRLMMVITMVTEYYILSS